MERIVVAEIRTQMKAMKKGKAAVTCFWNAQTEVRLVVHGDDFTFLGPEDELVKMQELMESWYEIKVRGMVGTGGRCVKEMTILNRELQWEEDCLSYQADRTHVKKLLASQGLDMSSKTSDYPSMKDDDDKIEAEEVLAKQAATYYRSIVARANYLSQDRPDIQFSTGRLC